MQHLREFRNPEADGTVGVGQRLELSNRLAEPDLVDDCRDARIFNDQWPAVLIFSVSADSAVLRYSDLCGHTGIYRAVTEQFELRPRR